MFRLNNWYGFSFPLYSPDDILAPTDSNILNPMSKEDMVDFLNDDEEDNDDKGDKGKKVKEDKNTDKDEDEDEDEDDDLLDDKKSKKKEPKKEKVDKDDEDDDEEEELDEEDELEADLVEPDEDKLELVTPVRRGEILKKYPNVFKDFPYLEKAYFREQQYTEVFPTLDEARGAANAVRTLTNLDADLESGNPEQFLAAAKDSKGFAKFVDTLLPALAKIDEKAYHNLTEKWAKDTIITMVEDAKRDGDKDLHEMATKFHKYLFGNSKFVPHKPLSEQIDENKKDNPELTKLQNEKKEWARQKFTTTHNEEMGKLTNSFRATIERNIDEKGEMTDYVKRQAVREANEALDKAFSSDKRFQDIVKKLWKRVIDSDYNPKAVEQIRTAYRGKAKGLLRPILTRARNEALRGMGKKVRNKKEEDDEVDVAPTKKSNVDRDTPRPKSDGGKKSNGIPAGMSTLEFMLKD